MKSLGYKFTLWGTHELLWGIYAPSEVHMNSLRYVCILWGIYCIPINIGGYLIWRILLLRLIDCYLIWQILVMFLLSLIRVVCMDDYLIWHFYIPTKWQISKLKSPPNIYHFTVFTILGVYQLSKIYVCTFHI